MNQFKKMLNYQLINLINFRRDRQVNLIIDNQFGHNKKIRSNLDKKFLIQLKEKIQKVNKKYIKEEYIMQNNICYFPPLSNHLLPTEIIYNKNRIKSKPS